MAPPAAKRRKRNVLPSSSEDEGHEELSDRTKAATMDLISSSPSSNQRVQSAQNNVSLRTTPDNSQPRAKTANFPHNAAAIHLPTQIRSRTSTKSASNSPEKSRRKPKVDERVKSGDIFSLFTKQTQRQLAENGGKVAVPVAMDSINNKKLDITNDIDAISDEDEVLHGSARPASFVGLAAKKRTRGSQTFKNEETQIISSSQRFLKPPTLAKLSASTTKEEDTRPWAERFGPVNLDELAVHKRKVADVQSWLDGVTTGRLRQRVLLLKGAAGTGKTTTIRLLADAMKSEVLEWRNPVGSIATSDGMQSMTAQFEEFIGRGGVFGQLDLFNGENVISTKPEIKPLDRRKRIILIEEFPNTFTKSSTALQSFRSTILQYLASNTPPFALQNITSMEVVTPIVMIVSETLLTTTSASADSFTAHRLLGPEILQHPGVGIIEFNAIAPTLLAKALELVVRKESRKSGRRKTPGAQVLKTLGEIGDIRSAIGSLEFLCLRGDIDGDWGAKVAFGKTKKAGKDSVLTKMEQQSLEMVTRREASLGIFHAVGKVVYNKRSDTASGHLLDASVEKLPDFMSLLSRPKRSEVDVDKLIDETGTDTQTFVAALHENYILSCDAPPTSYDLSTIDHVDGCIGALSDSDLLCPSWDGSFNSTGFGGGQGAGSGGDYLRQDEISFQIAVRGLLFSLPYPVTRTAPTAGGMRKGNRGEAHKMFYPTSMKLWRMKEDIESTIDVWVTRLLKGQDTASSVNVGAASFARPKAGTVESWRNSQAQTGPSTKETAEIAPLLPIGTSARKEMLLERLPYMLAIAKCYKTARAPLNMKEMEKVVTFHGIAGPAEEDSDDGDDTGIMIEEWATDKPSEGKSPRKKGLVIRSRGQAAGYPLPQVQEQKLYLSDDDIEDD